MISFFGGLRRYEWEILLTGRANSKFFLIDMSLEMMIKNSDRKRMNQPVYVHKFRSRA